MPKSVRNPILVATLLSGLVTLGLALNVTPWLRGGAGWRWPYETPSSVVGLLPGILVLIAYLAGAMIWLGRLGEPPSKRGVALFGLFCALGGIALQVTFLAFHDPNPLRALFMRTVSTSSGGFFEVGVTLDKPLPFLRDFPELMPSLSVHPRAHPPGIPLLFWLATRLFTALPPLADGLAAGLRPYQCQQTVIMALPDEAIAGAALGMALPALSMLALWPLYKLGALLYGQRTGLLAMAWWPVVPGLVMFVPQWNQLDPTLLLLALWALAVGLRRGSVWPFALSGLVMSLATFLSFTNVAMLGLLGVYGVAWVALAQSPPPPAPSGSPSLSLRRLRTGGIEGGEGASTATPQAWPRLGLNTATFLLGLALVWIVYYLATGVTVFEMLRVSLGIHYELGHPYLPWTLLMPLDLWLFGGLVLGVLAAWRAVQGWRRDEPLAVALGVSVVGLALSGTVRGEVGRLLLWLTPVIVLVAARAVMWQQSGPSRAAWAVSAALAVQLVVMVAFLRVIDTELSLPPESAPRGGTLAASRPVQATFGGTADLIAFEGRPAPDESALDLLLTWQPRGRFDHPNYMGVIVVGPDGQTLGTHDWLAGGELYPTSCWRPGELVGDGTHIPLEATPPGDYWLSLRMYDLESGEALPVAAPGLPDDTQIGLGPVPMP